MIRKTSLGYKYYNLNANEIPTDQKRTITEEDSEENLRVEVIRIKRLFSVRMEQWFVVVQNVFCQKFIMIKNLRLGRNNGKFV